MDSTTALTPDDLAAMTNALTLVDSAEIARLRRVAASGKVGEEAGKEAKRSRVEAGVVLRRSTMREVHR
jgi:hypothetical protein